MGLDEAAGDGQAEAAAALVPLAGLVAAEGDVEHARQVRLGDAAALVGDVEQGRAVAAPGFGFDADGAARRGVPDGVVEQVVQGAAAFAGRDLDGRERREALDDGDALDVGGGGDVGDRVGDGVREVDLLGAEPERAAVDAGQFEQVVDERGEPFGVGADLEVVALDGGVVVDDVVVEGLGHRPDGGERRAQVVGDPGDELAPGRFEGAFALLGGLQAAGDLGELARERGQFAGAGDRGRPLGADMAVAADHGAGVGADLLGARADVVAELPGGAEGDTGGDDEHDEEDDEVVQGDEHGQRGGDDAGGGDQDRREGDGHGLDAGGAAAQAPQHEPADDAGHRGGDRGDGDEDRDVPRREVEGDGEGGGGREGDREDQERPGTAAHQPSHR